MDDISLPPQLSGDYLIELYWRISGNSYWPIPPALMVKFARAAIAETRALAADLAADTSSELTQPEVTGVVSSWQPGPVAGVPVAWDGSRRVNSREERLDALLDGLDGVLAQEEVDRTDWTPARADRTHALGIELAQLAHVHRWKAGRP